MSLMIERLTIANKIDNYAVDATGGGLWTSTTTYRVTVPVNKRWFLQGGVIKRDASATVETIIRDSGNQRLTRPLYSAAATTMVSYPGSGYFVGVPFVMDAGDYLESTFGAAQGAGAYHSCVVLEIDV